MELLAHTLRPGDAFTRRYVRYDNVSGVGVPMITTYTIIAVNKPSTTKRFRAVLRVRVLVVNPTSTYSQQPELIVWDFYNDEAAVTCDRVVSLSGEVSDDDQA